MKIFFLTILLIVCLDIQAQTKLDRLNSIYERNDSEALLQFLNDWNVESRVLSKSNWISSDTLKTIDIIFKKMYCPTKWSRIGRSEFGKSIYRNTKFIIIQTNIKYSLCHSYDKEYNDNDSCDKNILLNYYPDIKIKGKTILYLTPEYDSILNKFLGSEQYDLGEISVITPAKPKGRSEDKMNFLNKHLQITHGHWKGWIILSHPRISEIEFDMHYRNAKVYFTILYEGGEAKFRKIFSKWWKVKSKMTWIT